MFLKCSGFSKFRANFEDVSTVLIRSNILMEFVIMTWRNSHIITHNSSQPVNKGIDHPECWPHHTYSKTVGKQRVNENFYREINQSPISPGHTITTSQLRTS